MFNLTAYKETDGTIKVIPLDDYYNGGTSYTIDEYIDVSQGTVDVALPFKEIDFDFHFEHKYPIIFQILYW